ncbi:MAG TPA: dipeptidase [Pyrinomonadaceae bacterium]|jgi:membrane dipeptidase
MTRCPQKINRALILCAVLAFSLLSNNCRMMEKSENQGTPAASRPASDPLSIHRRAISIDMHADTTQRLVDEGLDIERRLDDGHLDAVRMKEGGLDAQFFSIWVEPQLYGGGGAGAVRRADAQIAAVRSLTEKYPQTWALATTAADIRRIAGEGRLAALLGLEGGYAIDERLENVERYYKAGVRYMSPAWSVSTSWAGSSGDEVGRTRGLNDFGREVIMEMNRLGIMVDVSHVSDKTFWDIINTSSKPVIATHSGCRAIANVARNLDDEMLVALARKGGVCCVVFYPEFLEPGWSEKKKRVDAEIAPLIQKANEQETRSPAWKKIARDRVRIREYARRLPPVTVSRIVDHIDHIVKLAGIDAVGIGSDFDGIQAVPQDLSTVAELPNLTRELLRRGYSEADVDKILGGNILRVMEEVEKGTGR